MMKFKKNLLKVLLCALAVMPVASMADTLVIGHSLSLGAPNETDKGRAERVLQGTQAAFLAINKAGGAKAHTLALKTLDDKGSSANAKQNVEQLAAEASTVALLNMAGGGTCVGILPVVEQYRIPMLGCMAGSPQLRSPLREYVFNIRPGHDKEYEAMARQASSVGIKQAVFVHDDSDTGRLHLANAKEAMLAQKIELASNHAISKTTETAGVVADIKKRGDAIMVFNQGPNGFFATVVADARKAGSKALFMSVSSGADTVVNQLKEAARGVMFTQVVPYPFAPSTKQPIIGEYLRDLKEAFPTDQPSYDSFEAYLNARVLGIAVQRIRGPVTRETLKDALDSLSNLDVGGFRVQFNAQQHNGSSYTEIVMATNSSRKFAR